jgi:hypothetical protein
MSSKFSLSLRQLYSQPLDRWLPEAAVKQAKANYAAYAVQRKDGLRVITLNADMWYRSNYFNYINMTSGDNSGMLRFLTDELQEAEDAGERVWIVAHVLTGWDGSNPLNNPTNLYYQMCVPAFGVFMPELQLTSVVASTVFRPTSSRTSSTATHMRTR